MKRRDYLNPTESKQAAKAAAIAEARRQLALMPSGVGFTCGKCGHFDDLDRFASTPILGDLPPGQFQCPACRYAFQRRGAGQIRTFTDHQGHVCYATPERIELRPCAAVL